MVYSWMRNTVTMIYQVIGRVIENAIFSLIGCWFIVLRMMY